MPSQDQEINCWQVAAHGCLIHGPLDSVVAVTSLQQTLTGGSPPQLVRSLGGKGIQQ